MRGFITDPAGQAGLRLADDLPEPTPAPNESVVEVRAYAANHDELNLIERRPDGWRPGQDVAWYGNIGGPAELRLGDFYSQGWNAHIVGFISPVPEETKGEDLTILTTLVATGRLTPSIGLRVDWTKTPDALDALVAASSAARRS